ncbi:MAG: alpha/beta fold hydrolase [Planctomycetota bacterium]
MPYVDTCVGRLFVDDLGQGAPVLLWPSLLCDGTIWRHQKEELARDHRLLTVDPPGHGRSQPAGRMFTLEDCAQAALSVLDAWGFERAVFVGLSWGGMTALRVALAAPERVRALALFDTSADAESLKVIPQYKLMLEVFKRWGPIDLLVPELSRKMFGKETLAKKPDLPREWVSRLRSFDRQGVVEACEAVIIRRASILPLLPRIKAPALVACGDEDRATPLFRSERIARALPNARLETIPGSGHLSALEQPFTVNRLLRELLARV